MTAEMNLQPAATTDVDLLPQERPERRRKPVQKSRILAHLVMQLVALDAEKERPDGNN
jgi:hypothetical protein